MDRALRERTDLGRPALDVFDDSADRSTRRADLLPRPSSQRRELLSEGGELCERLVDPADVVAEEREHVRARCAPCLMQAEDVADLFEREAELLGLRDEREALLGVEVLEPVAALTPPCRG